MRFHSVIYSNFSQYDNTGRILDYLREEFSIVLHFSFDHLRLKNGRKTNLLTIYKNGNKTRTYRLYSLRLPPLLLFPSLPLVGFLMLVQTFVYTIRLRKMLGRPIFFTVNAYPASIGIFLRLTGLVSRTYYWVWDYFPLVYPDWRMRAIRYLYLMFDRFAIRLTDNLFFPNQRQLTVRTSRRLKRATSFRIIPLGAARPSRHRITHSRTIGFMGMLKESQGMYLIMENLRRIFRRHPDLTIEVIGSGPEEEIFRKLAAPFSNRVIFHGFIDDQDEINRIIRRWFAGLALYTPVRSNESFYGDPSKIKVYLSQAVPVITTNVTDYAPLCRKHRFGKVISYSANALIRAVGDISRRQVFYRKQSRMFAE